MSSLTLEGADMRFITMIAVVALPSGCATIAPHRELDVRELTIPVMLNEATGEPAGRILHAEALNEVHDYSMATADYTYTSIEQKWTTTTVGQQLRATLQSDDRYLRFKRAELLGVRQHMAGMHDLVSLTVEASAQKGPPPASSTGGRP